jgi:hypothetical protein
MQSDCSLDANAYIRAMPGILEQWRQARQHPIAALLGALLGGFVPLAVYQTTHTDLRVHSVRDLANPLVLIVAAGLLFSVRTVWIWGRSAFGEGLKSTCLVITIEGMMVFSPTVWLAQLALAYLVVINAVATACTLAREDAQPAPLTVTSVARERNLPRRAAAQVVDRERELEAAARAPRSPRPA